MVSLFARWRGMEKALDCAGRSGRAGFWGFWLVELGLLGVALQWGTAWSVALVLSLGVVPGACVWARRLHDIDRSAAWLLLHLVPLGALWLLWWGCRPGDAAANHFGEAPR